MIKTANSKQRKLWSDFETNLTALNRQNMRTNLRMARLISIVTFCVDNKPENVCPYFWGSQKYLTYTIGAMNKLATQIYALNSARALTQTGLAYFKDGSNPNDFDIVTLEDFGDDPIVKNAMFNKNNLPGEPMGPGGELGLIPLIVWGTIAVTGLVTGAIAATKISDTVSKKYEKELVQSNIKAELDMAKDPDTFHRWTEYKKSEIQQFDGAIDKLMGSGTGITLTKGMLGIGALAVVGILLMKGLDRK